MAKGESSVSWHWRRRASNFRSHTALSSAFNSLAAKPLVSRLPVSTADHLDSRLASLVRTSVSVGAVVSACFMNRTRLLVALFLESPGEPWCDDSAEGV